MFWNLNAIHAITWTAGQALCDLLRSRTGRRPAHRAERSDFLCLEHSAGGRTLWTSRARSAAMALRHRAPRPGADRAFCRVSLRVLHRVACHSQAGPKRPIKTNLTQLFNAKNLLLAGMGGCGLAYRRVAAHGSACSQSTCLGLSIIFAWGVLHDFLNNAGAYQRGSLWDLLSMAPYFVLAYAAAQAYDDGLFSPAEHRDSRSHDCQSCRSSRSRCSS